MTSRLSLGVIQAANFDIHSLQLVQDLLASPPPHRDSLAMGAVGIRRCQTVAASRHVPRAGGRALLGKAFAPGLCLLSATAEATSP